MKPLRVALFTFLILILMGIIAGGVFIRYSSTKALPDYNESLPLNGITDTVSVWRDSTGMPHIYAKNEKDLYRTVGYLMAQDRLWQMDLLRRVTLGRLSEIFGEEMAETDQLLRSLHFSRKSEVVLDSCSMKMISALEAFSDGVNQYMDDNFGKLPPEFSILGYEPEPWNLVHTTNLIGYMSWSLTIGWSTEVRLFRMGEELDPDLFEELIPDLDLHQTYVIPGITDKEKQAFSMLERVNKKIANLGVTVFQASNNWAISPAKSDNGHAILANDMHLELNSPGIWYQMHQVVPGKLNVSGLVLPGQPFIICGHNEDVAWGMTNVMVDDIDFYRETVHPDDSTKYKLDGTWKDIIFEKEIIHTGKEDSFIVYNRFTHRGPVVSDFKSFEEPVISMKWIGNKFSNELRSVYLFNRMSNWQEFRDAASTFSSISQNIVYADINGNIGMQTAGGIPVREGKGFFIYPGDTSLYDWKSLVSFEELPFVLNPEQGYVASANNRTIDDSYPYYISRWFDLPNRIERINESLEVKKKFGVQDMMKLQANQNSVWARKLLPFFLENLRPLIDNASGKMKTAFNLLESWDCNMDIESVEATIFEQLYYEFLYHVFSDEMGEELFKEYIKQDLLAAYVIDNIRRKNHSIWFDNKNTHETTEIAGDLIYLALAGTVDNLTNRLGKNMYEWQWGKVHTLTLKHPLGSVNVLNRAFKLNKGPFPVGGSYHTVSMHSYPFNDLFKVTAGSSHRHIYIPGMWDESKIILPTGLSGIPASPHYLDQTEDYITYQYNAELFSNNSVKTNALYFMLFYPHGSE